MLGTRVRAMTRRQRRLGFRAGCNVVRNLRPIQTLRELDSEAENQTAQLQLCSDLTGTSLSNWPRAELPSVQPDTAAACSAAHCIYLLNRGTKKWRDFFRRSDLLKRLDNTGYIQVLCSGQCLAVISGLGLGRRYIDPESSVLSWSLTLPIQA